MMRGSNLSPYDPDDLQSIEEKRGEVIEEIYINKFFKLDIYTKLDRKKIYFIGVDVANGYGEDNSAVTIFDPYELKAVAEFKSAYIGVKDLIKFLYELVVKHLPRAILAIERNANGESVLEHLRNTAVHNNLYFDNSKDMVQDVDDKLNNKGWLEQQAARRKLYGIYTQGKSRQRMFELLEGMIKENKEAFVCRYIIDDIMKLVRKNSKIQAAAGEHDDNIMSFLMCVYLYYYGNNLSRYGFVRGSLPTEDEMNKGMDYNYQTIMDSLSETDRQYFENTSTEEDKFANTIDISKMINENRGLISEEEMLAEMRNIKRTVNNRPHMDAYQQKIYREMQQAQRESNLRIRGANFMTGYEDLDGEILDDEVFIDFADLNS